MPFIKQHSRPSAHNQSHEDPWHCILRISNEVVAAPVSLPGPGRSSPVGRAGARHVSGFVHNYSRDGWLSAVCAQLLLSICLSDERGVRRRPVISHSAAGSSIKSPAQSHPLFSVTGGVVERGCSDRDRCIPQT